jgi:6-phosphogluconolactonase
MQTPEVLIYPTLADLQDAAAERVVALANAAAAERGRFFTAISGGSAPPGVFRRLTTEPLRDQVNWPAWSVVWADERYVPFTSDDSNYLLARTSLLDHVPIPSDQVYPVATYYADPADAVAIYDQLVVNLLELHAGRLDLALLGMGPDGHTASLFPGHPALTADPEALALVVENAPKPPPLRITLTAKALNTARNVIFLVAGADKAPLVRAALRESPDPQQLPACLIQPAGGHVTWMLDSAAAAAL